MNPDVADIWVCVIVILVAGLLVWLEQGFER